MARYYFILLLLFPAGVPLHVYAQHEIPEVNTRVITYVKSVIGSTVGRGECWDLADQALDFADAKFDKTSPQTIYIFGKKYNPQKEHVLPGDIIQFEGVTVSYTDGNRVITESYEHHTAIVFNVKENGSLQLAHQNTSFGGRKVAMSIFNQENVKKGKLFYYHPISY